ncbi:MAG TPA: hypothetical protein VD995_20475 [Azospirillum sp.]|nr:hypothetical protein [Azospirillum sp.]
MSFRLTLGAALLSTIVALNANAAFAQDSPKKGKVCVENAGAFVMNTRFLVRDIKFSYYEATDNYTINQVRRVAFEEDDYLVEIWVFPILGKHNNCAINVKGRAGQTITAKMYGTTLINKLDCSG